MCGIAGIYNIDGQQVDCPQLLRMTKVIRHRGPDDEGYLLANSPSSPPVSCYGDDTLPELKAQLPALLNSSGASVGLGFRRLSIIDLSYRGHMPMSNEDGSLWLIFNGEIYNYVEIRDELKGRGYTFRSGSDSEVILKSYDCWGTECLQRFNGMWAFALWDNRKKQLFCARDRFGVKPFYYAFDGRRLAFGSEIKQLLSLGISRELDKQVIYKSFAIGTFLYNSNGTYFSLIRVLPHSHYMIASAEGLQIRPYYDLPLSELESSEMSFEEAGNAYRDLFTDAVRLRMRSDVEVGSALSGGLDSSAIVTVAAGYTSRQFKTFSSYYTIDPRYDERKWIGMVVDQTGASAHYVSAGPEQVMQDFGRITWFHDYPVMTSSPLAQYYVMQLARENGVIVLLDGQGSDELTGGYNHAFYRYYADLAGGFRWKKLLQEYPSYLRYNTKGSGLAKISKTLAALLLNERTLYKLEAKHKQTFLQLGYRSDIPFGEIRNLAGKGRLSTFLYNQVMATCIQTLLHYEDRNSMAHSLESRVPFLDYRLVELAFRLPSSYKIHGNLGKYIHRESLNRIVPREIMERKDKIGFLAPGEAYWMRNEMRDYVRGMFSSAEFRNRGIFDVKQIDAAFAQYLKGDNRHADKLWQVLALEVWFREVYQFQF